MAWHYGFENPGPFGIIKGAAPNAEGEWEKDGTPIPTGGSGQTTYHPFEITAEESTWIGAPQGDYLMVRYETDPEGDIDTLYPWLNQVLSIGQGQVLHPEKETAIEKAMDTVAVGDATAAINGQVTAFNQAVDEYNTDHSTSHPHLDVTGDLTWVNDLIKDLPSVFGYRVAYFSASFGYSPALFTRDYQAPTP